MSTTNESALIPDHVNPLRSHLPIARVPDPCAIVLFGATGDLTARKLIPSLHAAALASELPADFVIVGVGRRDWTDEVFRAKLREAMPNAEGWEEFARRLVYHRSDFNDDYGLESLKDRLDQLDATYGTQGNRLFYLAVDPQFFEPLVKQLGRAGLIADPFAESGPWTRVIIEKPFGHDLASSQRLDRELQHTLDESQIYRIDHYLGKETVQNIMALRFGNAIFEPIWNSRHIRSVQITVAEDLGMPGRRGAYYDNAGAIRDMVQNHMMQLLSLVAMEPPIDLSADAVRNEKVKIIQALPRWSEQEIKRFVVRGQYGPGSSHGEQVKGFVEEEGVNPSSRTETYVAMRLTLNTWRWAGVPFYLRTGKRLPKTTTEVAIQFKEPNIPLFEPDRETDHPRSANQLVLRIQPNEGASLSLQAKVPGSRRRLREVRMDFRYGTFFTSAPAAYQRLLIDAMLGDATLYTRRDEVEYAWKFVDAIVHAWDAENRSGRAITTYPAGTWGPSQADELLAADGAVWRRP